MSALVLCLIACWHLVFPHLDNSGIINLSNTFHVGSSIVLGNRQIIPVMLSTEVPEIFKKICYNVDIIYLGKTDY
jgi:hypothetical protein